MLNKIVTWSLDNRWTVIFLSIVIAICGVYALARLPIDAFPDTTPVQITINTVAPSLTPEEIEQSITFPVEQAIGGLQGLSEVRSISKFGLSQVTVIFDDGTDIYFARQLVLESMQGVNLPEGIQQPEMGPVSTGLGEVYHYIVTGQNRSLEELTTLHDWVIKPRLRSVPGVAEINTWGGLKRQYHVLIDPDLLIKYDYTLDDIVEALQSNNLNVGGGNIEQAGEQFLVHGVSLTTSIEQIENVVISAVDGFPVRISDVASVEIGNEIRRGASTANGEGEVVLGLGFMLMGENSKEVTERLKSRLDEIKLTLPDDVEILPVYDRTTLVEQVLVTAKQNLLLGALLVIAVLFIFLGDIRAGIIVALSIPLSMCFAFGGMVAFGIAGSLMSLGAIDVGFIVDSTLVMVDNNFRKIKEKHGKGSIVETVKSATHDVIRPTIFAQLIIMIVYIPILTLEGIEGKLFRPMALTVIFALAGSIVVICTLIPVLTSFLSLKNNIVKAGRIQTFFTSLYRPIVLFSMRYARVLVLVPLIVITLSAWLVSRTGSEFIPRLSEMGVVINTVRLASVSLEESVRYGTEIEKFILEKFPNEVEDVWVRTGTAEVATDPMGIELSDIFITLKPRDQWVRAGNQTDLTDLIRDEFSFLPGMRAIFTQPIEMRVNEMIAGIRSDLGIKVFGDELEVLKEIAVEVGTLLEDIPGSADIYTEQITGQPILQIKVDQDAIARHGVPAAHVMEIVEAIGGIEVGEIREDQYRFDLIVRLKDEYREGPTSLDDILIPTANGGRIPLTSLASVSQIEGPSTITREWQKRRIVVQCNVTGRDLGGFVDEVEDVIHSSIDLPAGYHIEFGGQFEHLQRATRRLSMVVPLTLALIFFLLMGATQSMRASIIIFFGPLYAMLGGLLALHFTQLPFTVSAGVGFIIGSGVSVLNGLMMIAMIKGYLKTKSLREAVLEGALYRLNPILMAGVVAILGFLPMALSTGVGAEVQRPLATVVIGAVVVDNFLTLILLPSMYFLFGDKKLGDDQAKGD